jgi:hypothetical protein
VFFRYTFPFELDLFNRFTKISSIPIKHEREDPVPLLDFHNPTKNNSITFALRGTSQ